MSPTVSPFSLRTQEPLMPGAPHPSMRMSPAGVMPRTFPSNAVCCPEGSIPRV